jgi:hypothetical protein
MLGLNREHGDRQVNTICLTQTAVFVHRLWRISKCLDKQTVTMAD